MSMTKEPGAGCTKLNSGFYDALKLHVDWYHTNKTLAFLALGLSLLWLGKHRSSSIFFILQGL